MNKHQIAVAGANGRMGRMLVEAVLASPEGIRHVQMQLPQCRLWLGAVDDHLNEHFYIVPGLGDAGDLAYGSKL